MRHFFQRPRTILAAISGLVLIAVALALAIPARSQFVPGTACLVQTQAQLLAEFGDFVGVGAITPQIMRNFVCSVPTLATGGGGPPGPGVFTTLQVINLAPNCVGQPPGTLWNNGFTVGVCH